MPLTEEQRRTLLARSSSLHQRLAQGDDGSPSPHGNEATIAARMTRWRQVAAKGDVASFERLLASRNIAPDRLNRLLDTPQWREGVAIPNWIHTIEAVIAATGRPGTVGGVKHRSLAPEPSIGLFIAPFCAVALQRLEQALPDTAFQVLPGVYRELTDSLAHGLRFVCNSALDTQLGLFHIRHQGSSANQDFWAGFLQPARLVEFFLEYSVAARATAALMDRWHCNTLEWLQRLAADASNIELQFLGGARLEDLVEIDCGLSDPHNGGKSVMRLHFSSGLRLVYKPRSVAIDLAYNALLDWLAHNGAPYPLRKPTYLDRSGYAWVEQIDHTPCQSLPELFQFCRSAGALLCISYLLDATDLHDGNVIATGTSPVIVDLETLLQPRLTEPQSSTSQDALRKAAMLADRSILRTGLLPSLKRGTDGQVADVGCFGGLFAPHSTEWYSHETSASPFSDALHQDVVHGTLDSMALAQEVANGFQQTYRFMLEKRPELLAPTGPLQGFKGLPVRFLLRDTSVYIKLLAPSLSAVALREGVDRSIALESLYRLVHNRPESESLNAMIDEEIAALEGLDIPLLSTTSDSMSIKLTGSQPGPKIFAQPSYLSMLARLQGFGVQDLDWQLSLLHDAFAARSAGSPSDAPPSSDGNGPTTTHAIAAELLRRAVTGDDGSVTWMAPVPIPNTLLFRFDMLPLDRESGLVGIAFFLAAYCRSTGDMSMGRLARQTVQTVTQRIGIASDDHPVANAAMPIAGLGSMLYALHHTGTFLGDSNINAAAHRLAKRLPDMAGVGSTLPGSIADCSEVCLALIVVGRQALAVQWGQQLIAHWYGLAHGQKANAVLTAPHLALCWYRLHQMTQTSNFQVACKEALQTMCQTSDHAVAHPAALHFALLGCQESVSDAGLGIDSVGLQLDSLRLADHQHADNLREGVCSTAERLFVGGHVLKHPNLLVSAQQTLEHMTNRAMRMGGYQTVSRMPRGTFFPGFDQGLCGIGYTLLRHTSATSLPCVQLWE